MRMFGCFKYPVAINSGPVNDSTLDTLFVQIFYFPFFMHFFVTDTTGKPMKLMLLTLTETIVGTNVHLT